MKPAHATLYGIHSVREALLAGRRKIERLYVVNESSRRIAALVDHARKKKIPVQRISGVRMGRLAQVDHHQGIAAQAGAYPYIEPSRLLAVNGPLLILVMDGIQDPHNAGALIRTAVCVGVTGVVIPKDRSVAVIPAVSAASAGAVEHVHLARVTNINRWLNQLKSHGVWVAGLDQTAGQSLFNTDLNQSLALVVGNEQKGVRPLVKKNCDYLLSIPQKGGVDSLNVSVAGAVALYEAFRQRQGEVS